MKLLYFQLAPAAQPHIAVGSFPTHDAHKKYYDYYLRKILAPITPKSVTKNNEQTKKLNELIIQTH